MTAAPSIQELRRAVRRRAISTRGQALHEAGHAAVAMRLGLAIERLTLRSVRLASHSKIGDARAYLWARLVIFCAGAIAQRRADSAEAVGAASVDDAERAKQFAGVLSHENPRRTLEKARKLAERIVHSEWRAIEMLACQLESAGELTGDEVAKVFEANRR